MAYFVDFFCRVPTVFEHTYATNGVPDPDSHNFGKPDLDPHQSKKPDPYQSQNSGTGKIKNGVIEGSVADPGCLSRIRIFSIPDPVPKESRIRIRNKEFKYLIQKLVSKLLEI